MKRKKSYMEWKKERKKESFAMKRKKFLHRKKERKKEWKKERKYSNEKKKGS